MISLLLTLILGFASGLCNNKDITLILGYNYNTLSDGFLNQARTWFLKITSVRICVCVCVRPPGY